MFDKIKNIFNNPEKVVNKTEYIPPKTNISDSERMTVYDSQTHVVIKLLENIAAQINEKTTGMVAEIFVERALCPFCLHVMKKFETEYGSKCKINLFVGEGASINYDKY